MFYMWIKKAAAVFESAVKETGENNHQFNSNQFIDKHAHLAAIHLAHSESWPALCEYLLTAQDVTKVRAGLVPVFVEPKLLNHGGKRDEQADNRHVQIGSTGKDYIIVFTSTKIILEFRVQKNLNPLYRFPCWILLKHHIIKPVHRLVNQFIRYWK